MNSQRKNFHLTFPLWASYALLVLAVAVVYANLFGNQFIADDTVLIVNNRYLRDWGSIGKIFAASALSGYGGVGDLYRPLQLLLNLIIFQIFGLSTAAFLTLNIALQVANACLLYTLGRKLEFKSVPALLAALIWALHPIEGEAVAHISGVADLLFTFFCLVGVLILLPDFTARKFAYVCPIFILGLLSKESAIIFPLLAMVTMYASPREQFKPRDYLRTWPLWLIAVAFMLLRFYVLDFQNADASFAAGAVGYDYAAHILWRIYTCLATLPLYLLYYLWPIGLHFEIYFPVYDDPLHWQVLLGTVMVLLAGWQLIWGQGRRGLAMSWGLLWFFAAMAPNTGILVPVTFLFSEHWLYLPTAGLLLGAAESIAGLCEGKRLEKYRYVGVAETLVVIVFLAAITLQQNTIYRDAYNYYSYILKFNEPLPRVHANMAEVYMMQRGEFDKALAELQTANFLNDTIPEVHQDIAFVLMHKPDWKPHAPEAIKELNRALELRPDYVSAYEGLAYIYGQLGDKAKQRFYFEKVRAIEGKN